MLEQFNREFSVLTNEGGWIFWCLIALAFGIALSLLSIWHFLKFPEAPFLGQNDWRCLLQQRSRSKEILNSLRMQLSDEGTKGQLAEIGEEMFSVIERRIPFALVLISAAPLIGLLGTVSGMFTTFDGMSSASSTGPASVISKGVSEALITTQAGLVISVPAFFIHNALKWRYEQLRNGFYQIEAALGGKS